MTTDAATGRDAADEAPVAVPAAQCGAAGSWHGRIAGNDPDVDATLDLALDADCTAATGVLHCRSSLSGSNDRTVAGTWDPARASLVLHDVSIDDSNPGAAWRFCRIDRYDLVLSADGQRLGGTYASSACSDHATVSLDRTP